ncbi:Pyruvate dehydrogenase E1 component alpha subunit [Chondromyces apiculatus DSM 436]|uniref:Pyruvate dehydrogenase E1 component subunit alpha n=1 Tax=Chondromyces apiculatus DSM 436 TaxID=1192034 RepID=A0A017T2V9_9BACT|nr:Pyruvate dehydrogenase E1 component alpha subunit [Chondromyces apiculatus DSM 436]
MDTSDELHLKLYRQMFLIRRFEEEAARAYAQGKIGGFLHLYIGQEAIAVGAHAAMRQDDYMLTTYRDHGLALARGMAPRAAMAELFGKVTGCSKGLGGSMHFFDREHNMLGGYGIVGGHIPIGVGTAFASKYRGEDRVSMVFFGEGAVSIGDFHEGMSLASLWRLPVVFVCENNEYAMGTPISRTLSVADVSQKALGYGMARERFAAESVIHVRDRLRAIVDRVRETSEPTLVEIQTYRFRGHSMSDPGKYRTKEELEERKRKDVVLRARVELEEKGQSEALERIEKEVEDEVTDAIRFAEESPEPGPEILAPTTYTGAFAR